MRYLISRELLLGVKGRLYSVCMCSVTLYVIETFLIKKRRCDRTRRSDGGMCSARPDDRICAVESRNRLQLNATGECLQNKGSLLSGHIKRVEESSWPRKCQKFKDYFR